MPTFVHQNLTKEQFLSRNRDSLLELIGEVNQTLRSQYGSGYRPVNETDVWVLTYIEAGLHSNGTVDINHTHSAGERGLLPLPSNVRDWNGPSAPPWNQPMPLETNLHHFYLYLGQIKNKVVRSTERFDLYRDLFLWPGIQGVAEHETKLLAGVVHGYFYYRNYSDHVVPFDHLLAGFAANDRLTVIMTPTRYVHAGTPIMEGRERNIARALELLERERGPSIQIPGSGQLSSADDFVVDPSLPPLGYHVIFANEDRDAQEEALVNLAGVSRSNIARASDFGAYAMSVEETGDAEVLVFDKLGMAVVNFDPDQTARVLSAATSGRNLIVEPELMYFAAAVNSAEWRRAYLKGYRDAVNQLSDDFDGGADFGTVPSSAEFSDSDAATWGLQATNVLRSPFAGRGVRIAVLDTGFDLNHPEFAGRSVTSRSFIQGQDVQDLNGHGTHCVGTACGPSNPTTVTRRYGAASESEIFVGKVLSNQGSARGRSVIAGIEWAINNDCHIVSLSLGAPVSPGQNPRRTDELLGERALQNNTLLIAAAGNDSNHADNDSRPVSSPANANSIVAVGAVNRRLELANFSNIGINPNGGQVDLVGPGVGVFSSAPQPAPPRQPPFFRQWRSTHDTISGTSMATPHVAGIAALWLESNPQLHARDLPRILTANARRLELPAREVGFGLVQAPSA